MSDNKKEKKVRLYKQHQYRPTVREFVDNVECADGVFNDKGELVIRAYTDEEKAYLNQFNQELYQNKLNYKNMLHGLEYKKELSYDNNHRKNDAIGANNNKRDYNDYKVNNVATEDLDTEAIPYLYKMYGAPEAAIKLISKALDEINFIKDLDEQTVIVKKLITDCLALVTIEKKRNEKERRDAKKAAQKGDKI